MEKATISAAPSRERSARGTAESELASAYSWYRLVNGGPGGTYVLAIDHANWASFEDDPAMSQSSSALPSCRRKLAVLFLFEANLLTSDTASPFYA